MCQKCQIFLQDFLTVGVHKDLALAKKIKIKALSRILPQAVDWLYRFHQQLSKEVFHKAFSTASQIARRGRTEHEYDFLIHTATFNLLKHDLDWIRSEVSILETLLLESGFVGSRGTAAYDYISYMAPKVCICLQDLHNNHVSPKGLNMKLNELAKHDLHQEYNYQSEFLTEEECDDLYF